MGVERVHHDGGARAARPPWPSPWKGEGMSIARLRFSRPLRRSNARQSPAEPGVCLT